MRMVLAGVAASRRAHAVAAAFALALLGSFTLTGSAVAATVSCGTVVTSSTKLTADVGPCPGAGIIIAADNITVNLNKHKVVGDPEARGAGPDQPGVVLRQVHGVTLKNGTVTGFDAGVVIAGGARNSITRVSTVGNVNYRLITGRNALAGDIDPDEGPFCDLGDGIALLDSKQNVLQHNIVAGNGPYSGIAFVGDSDANTFRHNVVADNDLLNQPPSGVEGTICGGLANVGDLGRHVQDVGVRVEGPSAEHNVIAGNEIVRSALAGVMVTAFVIEFGGNNGSNVIRDNDIADTGLRTHQLVGEFADSYRSSGIVLHNSGSRRVSLSYGNVIEGNTSSRNFGAGIEVTGPFPGSGQVGLGGNTIRHNVVDDNFLEGIHLAEGTVLTTVARNEAHGNGLDRERIAEVTAGDPYSVWVGGDAVDNNPGCGSNDWSKNRFGVVNQSCVATLGTGTVIGSIAAASARAASLTGSAGPHRGARLLRRGGLARNGG